MLIGSEVFRMGATCTSMYVVVKILCQRTCNPTSDLVLNGEDVGQIAVVAVGPDVGAGLGVDELRGDANAIARPCARCLRAHSARRARGRPAARRRLALVGERRVAGDDEQVRKRDSSVMMSSVMPSEKYSCSGSPLMLVKGSTAIDGLVALHGSRHCAAGRDAVARRVDPHRPVDVLELLLAHILEGEVEPAADVVVHHAGDGDAARLAPGLRAARRH